MRTRCAGAYAAVMLAASVLVGCSHDATRQVSGLVRATSGQPLGGVEMRFVPARGAGKVRLRTRVNGRFAVDLRDGRYSVSVRAAGYAPGVFEMTGTQVSRLPDLLLEPARAVRGRAVDATGAPIGGADVTVTGEDSSEVTRSQAAGRTDAAGRFLISDAPASAPSVTVRARGYAPATAGAPDAGDLSLVLRRAATVTGRVTGSGGGVSRHATVTDGTVRTETDASGRFTLKGVTPGTVDLTTTAPGLVGRAQGTVAPGGTTEVSVTLGGTGRVAGSVVDAASGRPVSGAPVHLVPAGALAGEPVGLDVLGGTPMITDSAGNFQAGNLPPGPIAVAVGGDQVVPAAPTAVTVHPGATATTRISVRRPVTVTGRVVDAAGHPVPDASVAPRATQSAQTAAQWAALAPSGLQSTATADADGRFSLALPSEDAGALVATHAGYTVGTTDRKRSPGTITLSHGKALDGQVIDSRGRPVAGASVVAHPPDDAVTSVEPPDDPATVTRADGHFTITGLADAPYSLEVHDGHDATGVTDGARPGHKATVRLRPGVSAHGQVADDKGTPIANAQIAAHDRSGAELDGTSDWRGRFEIPGVRAGERLSFEATAGGHAIGIGTVHDAGDPVRLTLRRDGALRGRAADGRGRPLTAFTVTLEPPAATSGPAPQRQSRSFTTGDGSFTWADLPPGTWTFAVTAPGTRPRTRRVTIPVGGASGRADFATTAGTAMSGRVIDAAGRPVPGALIMPLPHGALSPGQAASMIPATTDADGRFALDGLPAKGGVRLSITPWQGPAVRRDVQSGPSITIHTGD